MGCRGIHIPGHTACLAHLDDSDRDAYLASLAPDSDVDHRGTSFTEPLLNALLDSLRDPATGHPRLGSARFESATFEGDAQFGSAIFHGEARFESAIFERAPLFRSAIFQGDAGFESVNFHGEARFESATFESAAWFRSATFQNSAVFSSANFGGYAGFASVTFRGNAWFRLATFRGDAWFRSAAFGGDAHFGSATFKSAAWFQLAAFASHAGFERAVFERLARLGPLVCAAKLVLSGAVFSGPVNLSFAARHLECRRTRWSSTAEVRLRYATVDFSHAVFEYPLTIAAEQDPFVLAGGTQLPEALLGDGPDAAVRMASLRGVDAAHLVLADVDLSECLFTGTVHLDQVRLEGACLFAEVPSGLHWQRWRPVRFTRRRLLAEEHHWRAQAASRPGLDTRWYRHRTRRAAAAGPGVPGTA
ncbi:pentapeptide repeat-containing protein [Streptomyces sp. NBC_00328]|uniref:pentapeptide repeat-containing protein n=1 Tax=Streptomyces sp. NBC_00328 TaxID=2903646 RepID=UPI002E29BBD2|nr:pentapeptide repeat-containing protein [Streptomyces sp. NBC_00328]